MVVADGRRKVALLGLSFKSGTDDLRESPIVMLAERLIGRGFEMKIFDPFVHTAKLVGSNKQYIDMEIPHLERLMRPDVRSTLEGSEVLVIGHVGAAEIRDVVAYARRDVSIVDLQGVKEIEGLTREYYRGICW
jgi:GDP-mannose 6-dehydrogenase